MIPVSRDMRAHVLFSFRSLTVLSLGEWDQALEKYPSRLFACVSWLQVQVCH